MPAGRGKPFPASVATCIFSDERGPLLLDNLHGLLAENRDNPYLGRPEASGDPDPLQYSTDPLQMIGENKP